MSDFKKYILKARILMIIEIVLIIFTIIMFQILENIIVGVYFILYAVSLLLWFTLLILTIILYYRAMKIKRE
ncbi:MAG: hypothetical protein ACFE96_08790 [Candidatus Hermodarchaeota archaeon]